MPVINGKQISVDIIIPTYIPDDTFKEVLSGLAFQSVVPDNLIIVNTEKKYWKPIYESLYPDLKLFHIRKKDFDHGAVRHAAARMSKSDVLVFMTQDAVPADENLLSNLLLPIVKEEAQMSYARHIPRDDSDLIESFTRTFNYPKESSIKSAKDLPVLGIKTFFCSNSCAAYLRSVYTRLGGFPRPVISNEDTILAGYAIESGFKIAYCADAKIKHSHNYSALMFFRRNFDIGVAHKMYRDFFSVYPAENEGFRLFSQTVSYVFKNGNKRLIPKVLWIFFWKYMGFFLGKHYRLLPGFLIRKFTENITFWENIRE